MHSSVETEIMNLQMSSKNAFLYIQIFSYFELFK